MITDEAAEPTVLAVPAAEAATEAPGREEPAWPWKDAPIQTLVQRIHQLQAERAQGFRRLEEAGVGLSRVPLWESGSVFPASSPRWGPGTPLGAFQEVSVGAGPESLGRGLRVLTCRRGHRQYLRSSPDYDFARYRSTVHEVTQAFAAASREVLAVEAELAGPRRQPLLASHVRSLQQLEQTRLGTVRPPPLPHRVARILAGSAHGAPVWEIGGGPSIPYRDLTPSRATSVFY
ncbi:Rex1bdp [Saguinus oedipus]|uniref:Rex1bdp n=1 Tax=Saguinus oedipus TaxID=9490 RepID=A0ABQ9TSJ5_SAGOE|nr:Rex1bdp [Saguinus oedipus]